MTFQQIKERQDVPVVVIDSNGLFIYVNERFCEVFGFHTIDVLGHPLSMIIPANLRDAHNMGFSRFLFSQKPTLMGKSLKLKAIDNFGNEFIAEHVIMAEKSQGHWQFAATITPL